MLAAIAGRRGAAVGVGACDGARAPAPARALTAATACAGSCSRSPATALSEPALDAALRLARAEGATLVPVYPRAGAAAPARSTCRCQAECDGALPLLEAIEQRAARAGVPVDARIERGDACATRCASSSRTSVRRWSSRRARADAGGGFTPEDIAWLLGERAGRADRPAPSTTPPELRASSRAADAPRHPTGAATTIGHYRRRPPRRAKLRAECDEAAPTKPLRLSLLS